MTPQRYADLGRRVLAEPARLGPVRLVAVDGHAGSGKTTFAGRLAAALRAAGVTVAEVHTDDLLDGWTDTVAFWPRLQEWVLAPLRRGMPGAYRRYDWHAGSFDNEWVPVPVPDVLVLDGVTSARTAIAANLTLAVWVGADRDRRLARWLARDGAALRPRWERWMADEDAHFAADRTEARADLVVDGAPGVAHGGQTEFLAHEGPGGRGWTPAAGSGTIAQGAGTHGRTGSGEEHR
jgi:uridine kinase